MFNERFLTGAGNILGELLPDYRHLEDVVRVIDVARESGGKVLRVLMNADLDEAVAYLSTPAGEEKTHPQMSKESEPQNDNHWRWRQHMAEIIAERMDMQRLGVAAVYVIGSTKNALAGPASDIDLLVHVRADENGKRSCSPGWTAGAAASPK
jgi:hypothetical protein